MTTTLEKRERVDRALQDPDLCILSDRALADRLGDVSHAFVRKRRASKPATVVARNGARYRTKAYDAPARPTPERRVAVLEAELELQAERAQRALEAAQSKVVAAEARAARMTEAAGEANAEAAKLSNQVERYQKDLARRRRREEHYVAELCTKLVWMGWETEEAVMAMGEGLLVCPSETITLSDREREMFREMWSEAESEVERHYHNEWIRKGLTKHAKAEAKARGLSREAENEFVEAQRTAWILEQMDEKRWPKTDVTG